MRDRNKTKSVSLPQAGKDGWNMSFYGSILIVSVVVHMVLSSERLCRDDRDMAGGLCCRGALLSLRRAAAARVVTR